MGNHKYTVEFRIVGEAIEPLEITALLGLQPCQVRHERTGIDSQNGRKAIWAFNGFLPESKFEQEWDSLEAGLLHLLEQLQPKRELIRSAFGGAELYWWCGHFQRSFDGGPTFSPRLLKELGDFGVQLFLDNYFSDASQ